MRRRLAFAFVFLFLLAGLTVQAQAQVTLGPIVADPTIPQDGFPLWVQDSLGNFASLCLGAGCTGVVNPDGTLNEAFYYFAGADIPFNAGGLTGTMLAEYFVEAVGPDPTVVPPAPASLVNGSRYRARLDTGVAPAGGLTFTVSNPWSGLTTTVTIPEGASDSGNTAGADDGLPLDAPFTAGALLAGPIDQFISNGTGGATRFGDGISAAPLANGFVVNVAGAATATATDFIVEGIRFAPVGAANVTVERGTAILNRTGRGTGVVVLNSLLVGTTTMTITSIAGTPVTPPIPLALDTTTGRFSAIFPITGVTTPPATVLVTVTSTDPNAPVGPLPVTLQDVITIRSATFTRLRTGGGSLSVSASSSFTTAPAPVLSVASTVPVAVIDPVTLLPIPGAFTQQVIRDFGPMTRGTLRVPAARTGAPLQGPPAFVTVTSNAGGSLTIPVTIR